MDPLQPSPFKSAHSSNTFLSPFTLPESLFSSEGLGRDGDSADDTDSLESPLLMFNMDLDNQFNQLMSRHHSEPTLYSLAAPTRPVPSLSAASLSSYFGDFGD
ncbi:hypothetical protein HDU99_001728, partial [Rhizoclosmatium hyalinum]